MRAIVLSLSMLVACGGSTASSDTGSADAATAASALVGTYHHAQVDATNLDLRDDGTFVWTIAGCDYAGGGCGTWTDNGGALRLQSSGKPLTWVHRGSFAFPIVWALVAKTDDGVSVTVHPSDGSDDFTETWKTGRVCPICSGNVPSGEEECNAALPDAMVCQ